jgi:hypothetical protein
MMFFRVIATIIIASLAACVAPIGDGTGFSGGNTARIYWIAPSDTSRIQFSMLDPQLNAAAATHSRDMAAQNRAWHFGSDGSSPLDRVSRVGYKGELLGETISETFESELETLAAWMDGTPTRGVIMNPKNRHIGFSWFQEESGKIWWTLVSGTDETF